VQCLFSLRFGTRAMRLAAVAPAVEPAADGGPEACYCHVEIELEELDDDGASWSASGLVHCFWVQRSQDGEDGGDRLATSASVAAAGGYEIVQEIMKPHEAIVMQPRVEQRGVASPIGASSPASPLTLFHGAKCEEAGVHRVTFYPKVGLVHKAFYFRRARFTQSHLTSGWFSPMDRHGLRLELATSNCPPYSEFDPTGSGRPVRFVASPFDALVQCWAELLPGIALLLHRPINVSIAGNVARSWVLGPSPELVQGVDFSLSWSRQPLYVIPIERRWRLVVARTIVPTAVLGCVALAGLAHSSSDAGGATVGGVLASLVALFGLLVLRGTAWHGFARTSSALDAYFVLALVFMAAQFLFSLQRDVPRSKLASWLTVGWLLSHAALVAGIANERRSFRGTWAGVVARARRSAQVRQDPLVAALAGGPDSKQSVMARASAQHPTALASFQLPGAKEQRALARGVLDAPPSTAVSPSSS